MGSFVDEGGFLQRKRPRTALRFALFGGRRCRDRFEQRCVLESSFELFTPEGYWRRWFKSRAPTVAVLKVRQVGEAAADGESPAGKRPYFFPSRISIDWIRLQMADEDRIHFVEEEIPPFFLAEHCRPVGQAHPSLPSRPSRLPRPRPIGWPFCSLRR